MSCKAQMSNVDHPNFQALFTLFLHYSLLLANKQQLTLREDLLCAFHIWLSSYFTKSPQEGFSFLCFTDERIGQRPWGLGTCPRSHGQEWWDWNLRPGSLFPKPALYTAMGLHQGKAKPTSSATVTSNGVSFRSSFPESISLFYLQNRAAYPSPIPVFHPIHHPSGPS